MMEQAKHPAAVWAQTAPLSVSDLDCITAVMLKILDGKCQMNEEQRHAYISIYNVSKVRPGELLGEEVHWAIDTARHVNRQEIRERIHQLRLEAEAAIPKPTMKAFKARVREALSGQSATA
jgi:hypothetical protein